MLLVSSGWASCVLTPPIARRDEAAGTKSRPNLFAGYTGRDVSSGFSDTPERPEATRLLSRCENVLWSQLVVT
ncbi:protein of unknown function [Hyphomicrobium sp. MC1]|nr:protein of unknown function [Hyphomicrobium sp. MC1]